MSRHRSTITPSWLSLCQLDACVLMPMRELCDRVSKTNNNLPMPDQDSE